MVCSSMVNFTDWMLLGFEGKGSYCWLSIIENHLTVGDHIMWSCFLRGADWMLLGV